jgi:menaquinone reductase, molybdopterin-binding-like subunit
MKIDRRSFLSLSLSLSIGGAAGSVLTPLPWKLMDDSSIWSQMWPWTPVPEDGEVTYANSTCTLCPGGCGITVRKVNDRAVKIEGMTGHSVNDGGICILGLSGLQLLYGPTRVKTPLKRIGERGAGKWQPISWDAAIDEVATKLGELREAGKSAKVGCLSAGERGSVTALIKRFLEAYGSPNYFSTPSMQDGYELALSRMHGKKGRVGFDFANSDFILSFGSGYIDGWGSPVRMFKQNSAWKEKKVRVVQVEPRLSNSAAKADKWLPIKPGTEAVLALGLCHVMIEQSLYTKKFVEGYGSGFKAFKKMLAKAYTPEKVAAITGIDKSSLISLAKRFARAARPIAICGRGKGISAGSAAEFAAVHALNALAGRVNKIGGVWAMPEPDYIKWPKVKKDAIAAKGAKTERADGAGQGAYADAGSLVNRLFKAGAKEAALEMLLVTDANPVYSQPETAVVKKALAQIPYVVSFSSFMDETAQSADLILPNHVYLERFQDVPDARGMAPPVLSLVQPVVEPQFNTKHVGDVIIELAKQLGGNIEAAFGWDDYETCLSETLGDKWDQLIEQTTLVDKDFRVAGWGSAFATANKRFAFSGASLAPALNGDPQKFPLTLIATDSMRLAGGYVGDPPFMIKTVADTVLKGKESLVEINPKTAKKLGLGERDCAKLATPISEVTLKVHLSEGIMPGLVALPRGLGHTAYDKFLAGKGVNINQLMESMEDPGSGLDATWGVRARLTKA